MMEFEVHIERNIVLANTIFIEAQNEDEAYEIAEAMLYNGEIELEEKEDRDNNEIIEVYCV